MQGAKSGSVCSWISGHWVLLSWELLWFFAIAYCKTLTFKIAVFCWGDVFGWRINYKRLVKLSAFLFPSPARLTVVKNFAFKQEWKRRNQLPSRAVVHTSKTAALICLLKKEVMVQSKACFLIIWIFSADGSWTCRLRYCHFWQSSSVCQQRLIK